MTPEPDSRLTIHRPPFCYLDDIVDAVYGGDIDRRRDFCPFGQFLVRDQCHGLDWVSLEKGDDAVEQGGFPAFATDDDVAGLRQRRQRLVKVVLLAVVGRDHVDDLARYFPGHTPELVGADMGVLTPG